MSNQTTDTIPAAEIGAIDKQILEQLEEVRDSGRCNMMDRNCVQVAADDLELYALVVWIEETRKNRGAYGEAVMAMGKRRAAWAERERQR